MHRHYGQLGCCESKSGIKTNCTSKANQLYIILNFIEGYMFFPLILTNIDFHRNSYTASEDDNIYFGGPNGVTRLNPNYFQYNN